MLTLPDSTLRICRSLALLVVTTCRLGYAQADGIQITSPDDGAVLFPNQTVAIEVEPFGGGSLEQVLFLTRFSADRVDAPPFFSNLTIPEDEIGSVNVTVYGRSSDGEFFSDEITVFVQAGDVLQELSVEPQRFLFFRQGRRRQIVVRGRYEDGVTRDLTSLSAGTAYASSSTDVVSVDEDGVMEARGTGSAVVSASNSGKAAEVTVVVDLIPTPIADAGPTQVVECASPAGALVTLDGSSSSDPDGDPLEFEWSVRGGAVLGASPTLELVFALGTHEAILTVDDGSDGASSDAVVIAVQDTAPPELSDVPGPVTVEQSGPEGATLRLPLPTVTDRCDPSVEVTSDAPASFPLGATTVTFTASDASGNSATAATSVTVTQLAVIGDLDFDGDVDRNDLQVLLARRNTPADGPEDPADLDGDGTITALDARLLVTRCTRARCAVE